MAKAIQFVAGDVKFSAMLTKVDRDKIYGFVEQIVKDEKGNPCSLSGLLEDGSTVILNGATALKTVDENKSELYKKTLKVVYQDGTDAVLVPSSYEGEVTLKDATLDELFNLEITAAYQLGFEDENMKTAASAYLANGKMARFEFNYRPDYDGADAILLTNPFGIFVLTGAIIEFAYLENSQVTRMAEVEDEPIEEEMDFGML